MLVLNKEDNYEPDQTKLRDYVKNLAIKYDTLGSDRTFNATGVGEVTVKRYLRMANECR